MIVEVFGGAVLANLVTVTVLYNIWRLTKNEGDVWAMVWLLVCAVVVGAAGYAITEMT